MPQRPGDEDLIEFRRAPRGRPLPACSDGQPDPGALEVQAPSDRHRVPVRLRPGHGVPLHAERPLEFHGQPLPRPAAR